MTPAYRFGVSEFTTWPWSFEHDVARYAAHGIDAIEITEFKLEADHYGRQLALIAAHGLEVSSAQASIHALFPDSLAGQPTDPLERLRQMRRSIQRIAPHVPPGTPFVVVTGAAPGGDTERVYSLAVDAFGELATHAADLGMRLAFEPLNPVLFNTDTALWGLDAGLQLVEDVGNPALGLCLDTWNVWQTPDLARVIERCAGRIFVVQVSDWRRPRSGADRLGLGDGSLDNAAIVGHVRATGYDGPYVLEIFSSESLPDSIWRSDLDALLARNRAAFADVWRTSFGRPQS